MANGYIGHRFFCHTDIRMGSFGEHEGIPGKQQCLAKLYLHVYRDAPFACYSRPWFVISCPFGEL